MGVGYIEEERRSFAVRRVVRCVGYGVRVRVLGEGGWVYRQLGISFLSLLEEERREKKGRVNRWAYGLVSWLCVWFRR